MARTHYTEQQRFTQVRWIWFLIIPAFFVTLIPILQGLYQQLMLGEPSGNTPMSDGGLVAFTLVIVIGYGIMVWVFLSISLDIEVTESELRYKLFSYSKKWNVLTRTDIADYTFEKNSFWKGHGIGYKRNLVTQSVRMNIRGEYVLMITVRTGKKILLSIVNKDEMERAMNKFMLKSQTF